MSKVKINEIEALTADLTITPNGTGVMEIAGEDDSGTLQLNTASQSNKVKIKAPSTAENYTLVLPTTDIDLSTNKVLKVDSITGSGSTAVGQLGYADLPAEDGNNLNASNVTSGTLPSARIPSPLPAATGAAFKLISTTTIPSSTYVYQLEWNLDDNCMYKLIGENITNGDGSNYNTSVPSEGLKVYLVNASTNANNSINYTSFRASFNTSSTSHGASGGDSTGSYIPLYTKQMTNTASSYSSDFIMEFATGGYNAWLYAILREFGTSSYYEDNWNETRASIYHGQSSPSFTKLRLQQIGIDGNYNPDSFTVGAEFRLYKYMEA